MSNQSRTKDYFTSIPPEIRVMIWELLLQKSGPFEISYRPVPSPIPDDRGKPKVEMIRCQARISILSVCKAFHRESEEILYRNTFEFSGSDDLVFFLQSISSEAYCTINHIVFHWPYPPFNYLPVLDFLAGCQSLETLTIHNFGLSKISKRLENSFGGLRLTSITFPDTSEEVVQGLVVIVEG